MYGSLSSVYCTEYTAGCFHELEVAAAFANIAKVVDFIIYYVAHGVELSYPSDGWMDSCYALMTLAFNHRDSNHHLFFPVISVS